LEISIEDVTHPKSLMNDLIKLNSMRSVIYPSEEESFNWGNEWVLFASQSRSFEVTSKVE